MHTVVNRITLPVPVGEVDADIERELPVVIVVSRASCGGRPASAAGASLSRARGGSRFAPPVLDQYSPLITKNEPRMVPASFDFCRANLNDASSAGTSMPSESLNPTARLPASSMAYMTLIERPLS